MRTVSEESGAMTRTAEIACHSCRKRKVKCDRELPACLVCSGAGWNCQYPEKALKPGPKIGSSHRQKRRSNNDVQPRRSEVQTRCDRFTPASNGTECSQAADLDTDMSDETAAQADHQASGMRSILPNTPSSVSTVPGGVHMALRRRSSRLNIHDFSFILHPSHEASTPGDEQGSATEKHTSSPQDHNIRQETCRRLGISERSARKMIDLFFENMVALTVFHEPSFQKRLGKITSTTQMTALLAAMMGYASRFIPHENDHLLEADVCGEGRSAEYYLNLASRCVDQALSECDSDAPPLCVLQALTIATHCRLSQGVRRKAWRSLGLCVRLAYELNLHLFDSTHATKRRKDDLQSRIEDEETRRTWWIIWEMDVFASTVRRAPTAMNWTQMEVLLPAQDDDWLHNSRSKSCFFEQDPTQRWKTLQECGTQSGKAWFIVINSFMMEARTISCPRGAVEPSTDYNEQSKLQLEALANSVQCFVRSLPEGLRFRQQHLSFERSSSSDTPSTRHIHSSIFEIYLMIQLTQLMIFRYDVFGGSPSSQISGKRSFAAFQDQENPALSQYFEASDNILNVVKRSCEHHYRFINPFLTSTIWLAAAVQLLHKTFGPPAQAALIQSRFDVLYLVYRQSVSFWVTQTAMQDNLEWLKAKLEGGAEISTDPLGEHIRGVQGGVPEVNKESSNGTAGPRRKRNGLGRTFCNDQSRSSNLNVGGSNAAVSQAKDSTGLQPLDYFEPAGLATMCGAARPPNHFTDQYSLVGHQSLDPSQMSSHDGFDMNFNGASTTTSDGWADFDLPSDVYDLFNGLSRYQTPSYGLNT